MKNSVLLAAVLISGAASLIYELASTEVLFFFFPESSQTVAVVLATFMCGLFLGALFVHKLGERFDRLELFSFLQIGAGISILVLTFVFSHIGGMISFIYGLGPEAGSFSVKIALGIIVLLPPAFFFGSSFAAIVDEYMLDRKKGNFGAVYAADVFGAMAGVLFTGFLLFPSIGIILTSITCASMNFIAAFIAARSRISGGLSILLLALSLLVAFSQSTSTSVSSGLNASGALQPYIVRNITRYPCNGSVISSIRPLIDIRGTMLFSENTDYGLVYVTEEDGGRFLWIDRYIQCGTRMPAELNLGETSAKMLQPNSSVLNIGLGCGFTLHGILTSENTASVDVVEINPSVISASASCFWNRPYSPFNDSRTTIYLDDAAHYLIINDKKYDAVVMDIQNPAVIHSSPLYTSEYFGLIKGSLKNDGVFSIYGYNVEKGRPVIFNTLKESFKNVYYMRIEYSDIYFASDGLLNPKLLGMSEQDVEETARLNSTESETNTLQRPVLRYIYGPSPQLPEKN